MKNYVVRNKQGVCKKTIIKVEDIVEMELLERGLKCLLEDTEENITFYNSLDELERRDEEVLTYFEDKKKRLIKMLSDRISKYKSCKRF